MATDDRDELFQRFQDTIDMSPTEMDAWADSDNREAYAKRKNKGQSLDEPLEDVRRLKNTPKSEWKDEDDGFNEIAEAREALGFVARMKAVEEGDDIPGTDPGISKREASLLNWGHDMDPDSSDFAGDRQR